MTTNHTLSAFKIPQLYDGIRLAARIDILLVMLLAALILFAPLPFGSVQYFSVTAIELAAALGCLLWLVKLALAGRDDQLEFFRRLHAAEKEEFRQLAFFHRHFWLARFLRFVTLGRWPRRNLAPTLVITDPQAEVAPQRLPYFSLFGFPVKNTGVEAIALLFLGLLVVQLIPLPSFLVAVFSPTAYSVYQSAARAAGTSAHMIPFSVDRYATLAKLLEYTAYFLIYVVVVNNIRTRRLYTAVLVTIFAAAVFQGLYGLYEFLSGSQHIFGYKKMVGLDSASGTFINRNHYAGYLEISIPLLIALAVGRMHTFRSSDGNIFQRLARALDTRGSQILLLLLMIVLVAVALVFSLSRSGLSFGLVSLLTFFFLYWRTSRKLSRRAYLALAVGGALALAVWIGLDPVLHRFTKVAQDEGDRWRIWRDTFRMFLHFPVVGSGAGTFSEVFPMYRTFVIDGVYYQAHNDYVQLLAEAGILGVFLLVAVADLIFNRLSRVLSRSFCRLSVIQIAAFCSMLSIGLHSLTDFGLQIPAIAVQTAIVAGLFFSNYNAEPGNEHN